MAAMEKDQPGGGGKGEEDERTNLSRMVAHVPVGSTFFQYSAWASGVRLLNLAWRS